MKKVIFLDIDGVLNSMDNMRANHVPPDYGRDENHDHYFDARCVQWFKRLIEDTGADIVISSTWRSRGTEKLQELWKRRNLPGVVVGRTGYIGGDRGDIILEYLREHPYDRFIMIDDDQDLGQFPRENFVHCNGEYGITLREFQVARALLNGEKPNEG